MRLAALIEKYFWALFALGFLAGVLIPSAGKQFQSLLIPLLMVVLFLTFLRIDLNDVVRQIRRPWFVCAVLVLFLLILPAFVYEALKLIDAQLALGLLLLVAMPPGVASPVLTDIVKGNVSLSLVLTVVGHIVAPLTVPFLFLFLVGNALKINTGEMAGLLALLIFLPLIVSQLLRKVSLRVVEKTLPYAKTVNVLIVSFIIYLAVAPQSSRLLTGGKAVIMDIIWLYVLFAALHLIGYAIAFRRTREDRIALSVSKAYMNNALAIALASAFIPDPRIIFLAVASELPWATMLGPFRWTLRFLR